MRRTTIDIHDLGPGLIKEAGISIPAEVGDSHFPSVDELSNYPDEDFALIMLDGNEKLRKYACMSPGTAYLNTLCLLGAWDRLPKTAAVLAGTNLMTILEGTSTPAPLELVEKVASAVNGDFRHEGDLVDFGGNLIVDITDLSEEKKASFLDMAGKGFKAIGTGIKNTWQSARTAPQVAGKSQLSSSLKDGYNYAKGGIQQGMKQMQGAKNHFRGANAAFARRGVAQAAGGAGPAAPGAVARWGAAGKAVGNSATHGAGANLLAAGAATAGVAGAGATGYGAYKMMQNKQAGAKGTAAIAGAGLLAGAVGGATVGGKKGRRKGRVEGWSAGYGSGSQKGYWKGRQQGYSLATDHAQRSAMVQRIRQLEANQTKEALNKADPFKMLNRPKTAAGWSTLGTNTSTTAPEDRKRGLLTYRGWTPGEATAAGGVSGAAAGGRLGAAVGGGALLAAGTHRMHQKVMNRPKTAEAAPMHLLRDQYPVQNPVQIKQAEAFFNEHWRRLHPSDRRTYSVNLVKAAEAHGVELASPTLEKYAGNAISTEAVLHLNARTRYVDDHGKELLVKLAEGIPVADPDHFADALTQIDEHYGISQKWDTHVVDPYAAVITKRADAAYYKWSEGPDTVTEDQLISACKEKRIPLTSALGEDGYQELSKAPVVVFQSLPDDLKHVISRIAA